MILGIGTDLLRTDRLNSASLEPGDPFLRRTFSPKEIAAAAARRDPRAYFALRFAGKEAVFKAFRLPPEQTEFSEIEILNDENGAPFVTLYGRMKERAEQMGAARIHISLTGEQAYAAAFAVLEGVKEP